jgi:crotonobetainyl-CoA:carnitine CoA-transferase CaiB-like acyl-CoA transferase
MLVKRQHPSEGEILDIRPANEVSSGHRKDWMPAPLLGQQTVEILREAGLSDDTIKAMLSEGSAKEYQSL